MLLKIKDYLMHYAWDLAYGRCDSLIFQDGRAILTDLHYIKNPYRTKWFADPFIIEEDEDNLHLLVEEFDCTVKRGRIAHIVIDKKDDLITDCVIVLSLPTHLSFPAVYRHDGEIYVHPENSQGGVSKIYRYDREADRLVDPVTIIEEPLTDAVIRKTDEKYEMFSTSLPSPNGKVLSRYVAASFTGPYVKNGQVSMTSAIARMGGYFYESHIGTLRVAQDCNGAYGRAVVFMDEEKIIGRMIPDDWHYAGIHTFNTYGNTAVIDLKKYDFPLLYKLKAILKGEDSLLY